MYSSLLISICYVTFPAPALLSDIYYQRMFLAGDGMLVIFSVFCYLFVEFMIIHCILKVDFIHQVAFAPCLTLILWPCGSQSSSNMRMNFSAKSDTIFTSFREGVVKYCNHCPSFYLLVCLCPQYNLSKILGCWGRTAIKDF